MNKQNICRITIEDTVVDLLVGDVIEKYGSKDKNLITHTHAYTEIFVCTSGQIVVSVENKDYSIPAGNVAIIPSHTNHVLKCVEGNSSCYSAGIMFSSMPAEKNVNLYKKLTQLCQETVPGYIYENMSLCYAVAKLSEVSQERAYLYALNIVFLLAQMAENNSEKSEKKSFFIDCKLDRLARLENIINTEYTNKLTLEYIAKEMHISDRQLMRIIKERYNMSFTQILNTRRLECATKMIMETSKTMSEIAEESGFATKEYFYRVFRRTFHVSPSEYRKDMYLQMHNKEIK